MNIKLQIVIENAGESFIEEITCFKREKLSAETLGLSLKESKTTPGSHSCVKRTFC